MIRCLITDRRGMGGTEELLNQVARWGDAVDLVQIREKDLTARELAGLARAVVGRVSERVRVLVNDRADVALACGCAGVHLRGDAVAASVIRAMAPRGFLVSVACHSIDDVVRAEAEGADLALLGPVFATPEKGAPLGVEKLAQAAAAVRIPVLALGGVTAGNAGECVAAGAGGIAGIRLFQAPRGPGRGYSGCGEWNPGS